MCAIFQGRETDVSEQLKCEDDVLPSPYFCVSLYFGENQAFVVFSFIEEIKFLTILFHFTMQSVFTTVWISTP